MKKQLENFYFIQIDKIARGPYSLRTLVDFFRNGKINLLTRCSADKVQWEPLRDVLSRCNVEYSTIERNIVMKQDLPQVAAAVTPQVGATVPILHPAPESTAGVEKRRPLIVAVLGALWHPGDQLEEMTQRTCGAFGIALTYQIVFSLLVTAARGYWVCHSANAWKKLWFAPLEMLTFFAAAFVVVGIFCLFTTSREENDELALPAIVALAMQGGTWGMTLFALFPTHFCPWKWCEWLAAVFLALSFTWFSSLAAETTRAWSEKSCRGNRYGANFIAVLMMLGISATIFYLIYLYKEF